MPSIRFLFPIAKKFLSLFALTLLGGIGVSALAQEPAPAFSQIIVFGDSLSDTGNVRDRTSALSGGRVDYPSHTFNYSNGRFTNDDETDPSSEHYAGVWHEQLAQTFLMLPPASFSLGGGTNYAFGGATTNNGTHDEVAVSTPLGDVTITVDDMGKQVDNYLAAHAIDPNALYIVWGGGNDLFNDDSNENVIATATRASALMSRLATAGAHYIMVPNVPPLGDIPQYATIPAKVISLNAASAKYRDELNAALTAHLSALAAQGIMPTVYRVDAWTNTIRVMTYPERYGFTNVRAPGQDESGSADNFLFWDDKHPTTAGHYWTAKGANDTLTIPFVPPGKAVNIATRVFVDTGERAPIAGFIVAGDSPKRVLIRGLGPSLSVSGVPNPLADPTLELFDSAGKQLRLNNNWRDSQPAEVMATGLAPQNDLESAIVINLTPGPYTALLTGQGGGTGNALIEVYDLEPGIDSTLANLSTRGFVGTGDDVMIAGVIIGDGDLPIVVVRAIGPTLAQAGIAEPLLDPMVELYDGNGAIIGSNDDWQDGQIQPLFATQLNPGNDHESALVAFLAPGNYTAVVRGHGGTTGVAVVEAYRIP